MTHQERLQLMKSIPEGSKIVTHWREINEKFVALKAQPCPFFIFQGCIVYANRPYNCRRFACMRPDVKAEPFEGDGKNNMMDRFQTSRVARRMLIRIQRKAQGWAHKYGWMDENTTAAPDAAPVPGPR